MEVILYNIGTFVKPLWSDKSLKKFNNKFAKILDYLGTKLMNFNILTYESWLNRSIGLVILKTSLLHHLSILCDLKFKKTSSPA